MSAKTDFLATLMSQIGTIKVANGYTSDVNKVFDYPVPISQGAEAVPFVEIDEIGENFAIADDTHYRSELTLQITYYANKNVDGRNAPSYFLNDLRSLIYTPIDLGSNVLNIKIGGWARDVKSLSENVQSITIEVSITYWDLREIPETGTGTNYYGVEAQLLIPVSKLITQLTALQTAMVSGYYPVISAIYSHHGPAKCLKNSVSVEMDSADEGDFGSKSEVSAVDVTYNLDVSIRVHTTFPGSPDNSINTARLLNSIDNWLNTHKNLGDGYYIINAIAIRNRQSFSESATVGGQINVKIGFLIQHIQA